MKKLCSDVIAEFLAASNISHVFDLTGGMIAYIEDSISKTKGIQCLPLHHEQAAGFAAEGYSRISQNFGVAIATSGPGATNLITAIGSSFFDSIPTLFITGQVHTDNIKKHHHIRQEGFQETDIVNVIKPLTKYAVLVTDPKQVLYELEKSVWIMKQGRPGSVLIDIPINIQRTEIDLSKARHFIGSSEHKDLLVPTASNKSMFKNMTTLQGLLKASRAPVVLIGNGVRLSHTMQELQEFVQRNNLPVVSSLLGLDSFCQNDMQYPGFIGSYGNRDANIILANADVIIALGTRLDLRQTGEPSLFGRQAKIIHVDIDEHSLNYEIKSDLTFHMDLGDFFGAAKKIITAPKKPWNIFIESVIKEFGRELVYSEKHVDPNTFMYELSKVSSPDAIVIADVGQNQMWLAQSWASKKNQRLIFSGGMGAMGFALPAAIGAWCVRPEAELIVICGDGGLQINVQELETVSRLGIPLKLFIMNNKSLGMVREFQDLYFKKNYQSTVIGYDCPDLQKLSYAYGLGYEKITGVSKKNTTLKKILKQQTPILIEVDLEMSAPLNPKIVFGHALDDQAPYLDENKKAFLDELKQALENS